MSCSNNTCSSAGFDLVGLSSSLAILISQNLDTEDLGILATFFTSFGDNLALIATSRASCESKFDSGKSQKFFKSDEYLCGSNNKF